MRRRLCDAVRVLLTIILSLALSLQPYPAHAMRAIAQELGDDISVTEPADGHAPAASSDAVAVDGDALLADAAQMADDSAEPCEVGGGPAHMDVDDASFETEPDVACGTLTEDLTDADGHVYHVTVTYDESAGVPVGAELTVRACADDTEPGGLGIDGAVERALGLGAHDRVLGSSVLRVSIEAGGEVVDPTGDVSVTIETDAIALGEAPYVEGVVVDECASDAGDGRSSQQLSVTYAPMSDGTRSPRAGAGGGHAGDALAPGGVTLGLTTSRLGVVALARVATKMDLWRGRGLEAWLLVPRNGWSVGLRSADDPPLEEGMEALACYELSLETRDGAGTELLVEARRSEDAEDTDEACGRRCALRAPGDGTRAV